MRVKTEGKRQEILAAARAAFGQYGYAQTSMAEISARLGGSKGTLYSYFSSKEELFAAVMLEISRGSVEPLLEEMSRSADVRSGLVRLMHKVMVLLVSEEFVRYRRMLIGEAGRSRVGKVAYEQGPKLYLEKFAELFATQAREGRFRKADAWQAALHMQSLCCGAPAQMVLEGAIDRPSDAEISLAAKSAADVFLRAYAVESAVPDKKPPKKVAKRRT